MKKIILLVTFFIFFVSSAYAGTTPPCAISDLTAITGASQGEVSLSWTAPGDDGTGGGDAQGYLVKYATFQITTALFNYVNVSTFTQSWTPATAGTGDSGTVTGLTPAVTFYFAIKAYDDGVGPNYGSWSTNSVNTLNWDVAKNTAPVTFNLTYPTDALIISTDTPQFDWTDSSDPGDTFTYTLIYSSYSDFSVSISSVAIASSTYKPVVGLDENATYWWSVRAIDAAGLTTYSSTWTFRVNAVDAAPGAFDLLTPTDSSIEPDQTPVFDWEDAIDLDPGDTVSYILWYSSYSNFSTSTTVTSISTSTYTAGSSLDENTTYWWFVRATDSDSLYVFSDSTFTVAINENDEAPASFDLVSPADGSMETVTKTLSFDWQDSSDADPGDTITYTVWYSTMSDFSVKTTSANIVISSFTPSVDLTEDATYWWSVRAIDSDTLQTVSISTWTVNINTTDDPPNPFNLLTPINYGVTSTKQPSLDWEDAVEPDADDSISKYRIDWAQNVTFDQNAGSADNVLISTYTITYNLTENTTYWWKVTAYDGAAQPTVSSTTTFRINGTEENPVSFNLTSPADTNIETTQTPAFDWASTTDPDPGDSILYTLIYSSYSDFSLLTSSVGLVNSNFTPSVALDENTTYWWKVRAVDTTALQTVSNSTWSIRINAVDENPVSFDLTLPTNGEIVTTLTPSFDWENSSDLDPGDIITYTVWYSTKSDFSVKTTSAGITISSFTPTSSLIENATYWWSVRAVGSDTLQTVSNSTWTVRINSVNDNPNSFNLQSPADEANIFDLTPVLQWEEAIDPDPGDSIVSYTLQYGADPGFGSYTEKTGIVGLGYTFTSSLTNNETYYWRMKAIDSNAGEVTSSSFSFITDNHAPGSFSNTLPVGTTIITTLNPMLDWGDSIDPDVGDSVTYTLIYSSYSNFSSTFSVSGLGVSQSNPSAALEENTTYWWKVRAYDTNGTMTESSSTAFQTNSTDEFPSAFDLVDPSGIITTVLPTFDWQDSTDPDPGDTITYTLYYSSYSNFSASDTIGSLNVSESPPLLSLTEDTTYWWFVKTEDNDGYAVWSSTWAIQVNATDSYPATFNLLSPVSGTTVQTITPVFDWEDSSDVDPGDTITYTLFYATDSNFTSSTTITSISTSTYTPVSDLTENASYWWNVRAVDSDGLYTVGTSTFALKVNAVNDPPNSFDLLIPSDSSTATTTDITFTWNATADPDPGGSVTYTLIYSTYSNFSSSTVITDISVNTTDYTLTDNTVYYWKVVAVDSTTLTTESISSYYFTINVQDEQPASFDLLLPSSGTVVNTRTPLFDWEDTSDADPWDTFTYTVKYSLSSDFSSSVSSAGLVVSQFTPDSNLTENLTYWWSVTAIDSDALTTVSDSTYYFKINEINDPPSSFNLTEPSDGLTLTNISIPFSWEDSVDPDPDSSVTYTLYYSTYSNFSSSSSVSGLTASATTFTVSDNLVYYWTVVAIDSTTLTTESNNSWQFTVNQENDAPGTFSLESPSNYSLVSILKPPFDWEDSDPIDPGDSITYKITYSVDPDMPILNSFVEQGLTASQYTPTTDLANNTTYYWKITAYDIYNVPTDSTESWQFLLIQANEPPSVFNLTSPSNGETIQTRLPKFTWEISEDPNPDDTPVYTLYYSTYSTMFSSRAISVGSANEYQLTSTHILLENQVYYWRVKAEDDEAAYTFSNGPNSFTIPVLTVPKEVIGVYGSLQDDGDSFVLNWEAVDKNENGSAIDDLAGYAIYSSVNISDLGSGTAEGITGAQTVTWSDASISRKTVYYVVRAFDESGIESRNSLAVELSDEENVIALSRDNKVAVTIPKTEAAIFYKDTSPYGDNMKIDIERNNADEGSLSGRVLRSFEMNLIDSAENVVNGFSFGSPVEISFNYQDAVQSAPGFTSLVNVVYGLGLFWHNGVEFVKIGGTVNTSNNTISIRTKQLGKYRVMNVARALSFEFVQLWPKRIFTPNGDGINDEVNFLFENPKLSVVAGKVYDIHGAYIADLAPGDDPYTVLIWDGRDKSGSFARKGIYIYQIKCEGKVYNGTVVVAR